MDHPSDFPFLRPDEFRQACGALQSLVPHSLLLPGHATCLRISRHLADTRPVANADPNVDQEHDSDGHDMIGVDQDDGDEMAEIDDQIAPLVHPQQPPVSVQYDIVLSPSYRVPVVYMTVQPPRPVSRFFDLVVPCHFKTAMRQTGVMGALSMTDHPLTGMSAYFVHPCRTADAMRATGQENISVLDYMLVWLGIVGASVGLSVPSTALRPA